MHITNFHIINYGEWNDYKFYTFCYVVFVKNKMHEKLNITKLFMRKIGM